MSKGLGALVPVDVGTICAALLPFQGICQFGGAGAEGEVERRVWLQHHGGRHLEAVEVAGEGSGGHRNLFLHEVVAR